MMPTTNSSRSTAGGSGKLSAKVDAPTAPTRSPTLGRTGRQTSIFMHQLITGYPRTDHKNHDGLDNRRRNLRAATVAQNQQNARSHLGSTSRYKGVSWNSKQRRWIAAIRHQGNAKRLGTFGVEKDAALAYDRAAQELFGEFAVLNFPKMKGQPPRRSNGSYEANRDRIRALIRQRLEDARAASRASGPMTPEAA
jgi:hypothetical protein